MLLGSHGCSWGLWAPLGAVGVEGHPWVLSKCIETNKDKGGVSGPIGVSREPWVLLGVSKHPWVLLVTHRCS